MAKMISSFQRVSSCCCCCSNGKLSPLCSSFLFMFRSKTTTTNIINNPSSSTSGNLGVDEALDLFHKLIQMQPQLPCSIHPFTQLLGYFVKKKYYSTNKESIIQPNIVTFHTLINCSCYVGRVDLGFAVLGKILKHGFEPDVFTFNTLSMQRETTQCLELFYKIANNGSFIHGLCNTGQLKGALSFFEKMLEKGVSPNVITFSILIDSHLMLQGDEKPNVITYNSLIHGLCISNQWKKATEMFNDMISRGISLDVCTYNILIDAISKEGKIEDAHDLFEVMIIQRGMEPNTVTYNMLIDGLARKVFDSMWGSTSHEPDVHSYSILINGYCKANKRLDEILPLLGDMKAGKLNEAKEIFYNLSTKGLQPNIRLYNAMINNLFKEAMLNDAQNVFNEMEEKGLAPDDQGHIRYHVSNSELFIKKGDTCRSLMDHQYKGGSDVYCSYK
ncbi:hypothetical protein AQUCO_02500257v1 [Aquilegia coerulea]|uniref:Pentacotripeptide-repeat region of PRORP domain-containing protein n=1 Tax=Aquilegia coerulea TaxID=218851 RepID=A0A2G5DA80_AQUCA|nr:hypothetical protein AQUCO_02500257v1 [Aquilegia coerulea]